MASSDLVDDLPVHCLRTESNLEFSVMNGAAGVIHGRSFSRRWRGGPAEPAVSESEMLTLRLAALHNLTAMKRAAHREPDRNPQEPLEAFKAAGEEHL